MVHEIQEAGHDLRAHKCAAWAPGYDHITELEAMPAKFQELANTIPRAIGGIELLGSIANSE